MCKRMEIDYFEEKGHDGSSEQTFTNCTNQNWEDLEMNLVKIL